MASVLSLSEFLHRFPSEDECYEYLAKKRWPNGFRCPRCGHPTAYYLSARKKYQCINCRHQTSVTAGTVFHKLRQPLSKLFWAVYLIATTKKGISAMELQRKLGLKSYRTAWTLLHKIRVDMATSQAFPLTGTVEVDETYIGGRRPGKRGRGAEGKSLVAAFPPNTYKNTLMNSHSDSIVDGKWITYLISCSIGVLLIILAPMLN